ncbi:hypothetical protein D9V86_03160 [Bacteroidetes/Chlorobi group bacterium ChocPot_Mid]|nr:MAG: hypothetical protein D9V86_03160 [Bacteroidetes/Chlorobi group bacterium ChocPot_Mid]
MLTKERIQTALVIFFCLLVVLSFIYYLTILKRFLSCKITIFQKKKSKILKNYSIILEILWRNLELLLNSLFNISY